MMSRIPDYEQMRGMLVNRYQNMDNDVILKEFIDFFGEHKIPKIDFNQEALKNEDKRIERGDPR